MNVRYDALSLSANSIVLTEVQPRVRKVLSASEAQVAWTVQRGIHLQRSTELTMACMVWLPDKVSGC